MNRQKTKKFGYFKAWIALAAVVSCFLIYALACVLSPVTWSPDSSKIAILVTPPEEDPNMFAIFSYDIARGKRVLLDEVEENGVLSAPAWSPDGKWIAYYKVEPTEEAKAKEAAEELFNEENKMMPSFLLDIIEEKMDEEDEDRETFDVKLMVVRPDGKERKILRIMEWQSDEDARQPLMLLRPEWSKDSKHLFYARALRSDEYYIGSLNIATGEVYVHLFSSLGTPAISPDGKWIASLLEAGSEELLLTLARVDGSAQKYFKLDLDIEDEGLSQDELSWSPKSKRILIAAGKELCIVEAESGNLQKYHDPDTEGIVYGRFSPDGKKLYYLAGYESGEPDSTEGEMRLMRMNLKDKKTKKVFELSELPEIEQGRFCISPNSKMVLLRCVIKEEDEEDENIKTLLIFWDGKKQKIVETDHWLKKPL